jgi:hypothetical protein
MNLPIGIAFPIPQPPKDLGDVRCGFLDRGFVQVPMGEVEQFMDQQGLPVLAHLRNTQHYVNAAFEGKSLFDLPPHIAERDVEQWRDLIDWLDR